MMKMIVVMVDILHILVTPWLRFGRLLLHEQHLRPSCDFRWMSFEVIRMVVACCRMRLLEVLLRCLLEETNVLVIRWLYRSVGTHLEEILDHST